MRPVYQTTGAAMGKEGNCFQACVASLFDMRLENAPALIDAQNGAALNAAQISQLTDWLCWRDLTYIEIGFSIPRLDDLLDQISSQFTETHYILTGRSQTYRTHCVIAKGDRIVHDPGAPAGQHGLRGPCHDGFWRIGIFVKIL